MKDFTMHTPDKTEDNIERLAELFPACVTEYRNDKGELVKAIDFDLLKQECSSEVVEGAQERYRLDWPGKRESILTANTPINKTLRPCIEESVNFDTTENLFIEGDNLEALKLLQASYLGKIKMIYIDPPYNTGKDFIYRDNFADNSDNHLQQEGKIDEDGNKFSANLESNGRFHSDWLSMMNSRLRLARNLLSDDGVIFISIDDNEQATLKLLCDEVFGERNYLAKCIHKNNANKNQSKFIGVSTEYIFIYAKDFQRLTQLENNWRINKEGAKDIAAKFKQLKEQGLSQDDIEDEIKQMYKRPKYAHLSRWNKVDDKGVFLDADLSREGGRKDYTIINPASNKPCIIPHRGWGKSHEELLKLQEQDLIWYGNEDTPPRVKSYIQEEQLSVPDNFWYFDNSIDTRFIKNTFGKLIFDNPKSIEMIKRTLGLTTKSNDIILDFFAGSGTTAHAVMQLNAEDGGQRRFICVQLPELTDEKSEAYKAGYKTIAEISKERIRRAGSQLVTQAQHSTAQHSTAQHSTAQHSTAQHSTAQICYQKPYLTLKPSHWTLGFVS